MTLSRSKERAALVQKLEHAVRRSSAQGVIFGQTVASRMGISSSDLECLDILNLEDRVTAGRLAEVTGLTTGAITGVIDRLEKAGFVQRERDETDRRKVFIKTIPAHVAVVGKFYESVQRAMLKVWSEYSDEQLRLLLKFANQGYETMRAETAALKTADTPASKTPATRKRRSRT